MLSHIHSCTQAIDDMKALGLETAAEEKILKKFLKPE
jgi:hypothetical protein